MLPLHYASFFDAAPILRVLLKASNARGKVKELVNSMLDLCSDLYIVTVCQVFYQGTLLVCYTLWPLHCNL